MRTSLVIDVEYILGINTPIRHTISIRGKLAGTLFKLPSHDLDISLGALEEYAPSHGNYHYITGGILVIFIPWGCMYRIDELGFNGYDEDLKKKLKEIKISKDENIYDIIRQIKPWVNKTYGQ